MRILLTGATGLIGSAIAACLTSQGHEVIGVARRLDESARRISIAGWITLDLRTIRSSDDWLPYLSEIDVVVNCAGALQDSPRDSVQATHAEAPSHLWKACKAAGVPRVIQISAAGVDRNPDTPFMQTKLIADEALISSGLDWTILRPTLVLGRAAYGGSALFRALAILPIAFRVPSAAGFNHVHVDDVVDTVAWAIRSEDSVGEILELAGSQNLSFEDLIVSYRSWFGLRPACTISIPSWALACAFRLGDAASMLGWRAPVRTTAWRETLRGSTGDGRRWSYLSGIEPRNLSSLLASEPASVQERWFAGLYLLKPMGIATFSLFWIITAIIAATWGYDAGLAQMTNSGIPLPIQATWASIVADAIVGGLIAIRSTARLGLRMSLGLTGLYAVSATILEPELWADPLGPLVKLLPVVVLNLFLLAILEER